MRSSLTKTLVLSVAVVSALAMTGCTNASLTATAPAAPGASGSSEALVPTDTITEAPLDATAAALLPAAIKAAGVLTVATDPTYPPSEMYAADNKTVVGFDPDLATAIGQTLGLTVEMVPATFDTILPGIASKKYDMGMSAFSVTDERKQNADFIAYLIAGSGIAVPPGNPKNVTMDPMSECGLKIAGQKGSTQGIDTLPTFSKQCTDAGKAAIDIQLFPSQSEANLALISGRVDAVMASSIALAYQSKLAGGTFELAKGSDYDTAPTGIALPKDSPLTPAIRAAMQSLLTTPIYAEIFSKWGMPANAAVTAADIDSK